MRLAIVFVLIAGLSLNVSAENQSTNSTIRPTNRKIARREAVLRVTGGRVLQPNSGRGVFLIANNQKLIPQHEIQNLANLMQSATMIEIRVTATEKIINQSGLKDSKSQMGITLISEENKPGLLLAPEEGWAIVNVASLNKGMDAKQNLIKRVKKEVYRAFGLLVGGCGSSYQGNLFDPINNPEDLDIYPESDLQLPIDILQKIPFYCNKFGLKPWRATTYRRACIEGWAKPPANEYQKAIWEKVRSEKERGPTNPIEIPMPKKK